jgi:UDP-N-acetylmuramoylalanine--D-glutamate ligase
VVYELSELQLPTLSRGTTVAVYTNVTADHLDRHGSVDAYQRVKRRLAELVDPAGALVLNLDDPVVAGYAGLGTAPAVGYRLEAPVSGGVGIVDGWITAGGVRRLGLVGGGTAATGRGGRILPISELAIPGRHNVSNALAAVSVALLLGVEPDEIRQAAGAFGGVPHRLETVARVDGIRFVNDSMGTQPDAVIAALRAFDGPIVLIAGGRDKGVEMEDLAHVVAERATAAVLIGESAADLEARFREAGLGRIEIAGDLARAVPLAARIAREAGEDPGVDSGAIADGTPARAHARSAERATVLLSPAAASFDQFVDYAARGEAFREAVERLKTPPPRTPQRGATQ